MNKTELINAVAEKTGLAKKDAEAAVKAVTETSVQWIKVCIWRKGLVISSLSC